MLTRAAVAKAQEASEGGGAGGDCAEEIDEALMGLQVSIGSRSPCTSRCLSFGVHPGRRRLVTKTSHPPQ
jgi:hypothetical protein